MIKSFKIKNFKSIHSITVKFNQDFNDKKYYESVS